MSFTNANLANLAFDSSFRYEHVVFKGRVIIPTNNSPQVINHNLGYVPYCRVYYEYNIGGTVYSVPALATPESYIEVDWLPTTTQLQINAFDNNNGAPGTFVNLYVYYRIYAEPVQ